METREKKKFIPLKDLEIYRLSRELSKEGWTIYEKLSWQTKKIIGDQFIEATDSVGANIAEGYARFHYLDKIKFYYNARGSLSEAGDHWIDLMNERKMATDDACSRFKRVVVQISIKLNNMITTTYRAKYRNE